MYILWHSPEWMWPPCPALFLLDVIYLKVNPADYAEMSLCPETSTRVDSSLSFDDSQLDLTGIKWLRLSPVLNRFWCFVIKTLQVRLQCFKVGLDREKCLRTCLRLWPCGFESHVCYRHESCSVCFVRNPPKCVCKSTAYKLLRSLIHVSSNAGSDVSLFEPSHSYFTFLISQRHCFPLYFVYMLDSNAANNVLCFMAFSSISMSVSQSSCLRYL